MKDNKFLAWTAFVLFILSVGLILLFVLLSPVFGGNIENPVPFLLAIGVFSLLGTIMGFLSFKTPQAKVGAIGNLLIVLLVLFIVPIGRETTIIPPQPEDTVQDQPARTGIAELDTIIDTVLEGNPNDEFQLLHFSSLACTNADGLGGPPKCGENEAEGTVVEVFPVLGAEGHHMRKSEMDDWEGIQVKEVYTAYRVSPQAYSDESYPAGEYAIVFSDETDPFLVTVQVTDGKIVRIDYHFGSPANLNLERDASEIILAPQN